jgi:hypothetical protein
MKLVVALIADGCFLGLSRGIHTGVIRAENCTSETVYLIIKINFILKCLN